MHLQCDLLAVKLIGELMLIPIWSSTKYNYFVQFHALQILAILRIIGKEYKLYYIIFCISTSVQHTQIKRRPKIASVPFPLSQRQSDLPNIMGTFVCSFIHYTYSSGEFSVKCSGKKKAKSAMSSKSQYKL
jgi:hypothetical protein